MQPRQPAGPIQRPPAGLISILGLVGSELVPNTLGPTVTPTIDVLQMYLARNGEWQSATVSPADGSISNGFPLLPIVPAGELWVYRNATAKFTIDVAGSVANFGVMLLDPGAGTNLGVDVTRHVDPAPYGLAGTSSTQFAAALGDLMLVSQQRLGVRWGRFVEGGTGPGEIRLTANVLKFKV